MAKDFSTMDNATHRLPQHSRPSSPQRRTRPARRSGGNHQWPAGAARRGVAGGMQHQRLPVANRPFGLGAVAMNDQTPSRCPWLPCSRFCTDGATPSVVTQGNMPYLPSPTPEIPRPSRKRRRVCITMAFTTFRSMAVSGGLLVTNQRVHRRRPAARRWACNTWSADKVCQGTGGHALSRWSRWSIAVTVGSWCGPRAMPVASRRPHR